MTSTKYIAYIYKIYSSCDKTVLFISSTREQLSTLLLFFIKNSKTTKKSELYNWIRPQYPSNLKIKLIKSYPVLNKEDQEKREKYWIRKYKNYGYSVIHNPIEEIISDKEKIYVCIENTTMDEIIKHFGKRVLSISKEELQIPKPIKEIQNPKPININKTVKSKIIKELPVLQGEGYMNELKNLLNKRNTKPIKEIQNPKPIKEIQNPKPIKEIQNPKPINITKTVKSKIIKELPVLQGDGYMNELKNLLNKRKNGYHSIAHLTPIKANPNYIKNPTSSNPIVYCSLLEELKDKIKIY